MTVRIDKLIGACFNRVIFCPVLLLMLQRLERLKLFGKDKGLIDKLDYPGLVDLAGQIDQDVIAIARTSMAPALGIALRGLLDTDIDPLTRSTSTREQMPDLNELETLHLSHKTGYFGTDGRGSPRSDIQTLPALIGGSYRYVFNTSQFFTELKKFLLGDNAQRSPEMAKRYSEALVKYLLGKEHPKRKKVRGLTESAKQLVFRNQNSAGEELAKLLDGVAGIAEPNIIMRLVIQRMALGAATMAQSQIIAEKMRKDMPKMQSQVVDHPNERVQTIGRDLLKVEEKLQEKLILYAQAKSGLNVGNTADRMLSAVQFTTLHKEVSELTTKRDILETKFNIATGMLAGGGEHGQLILQGFKDVQSNIGGLAKGVVFRHLLLERILVDTRSALSAATAARDDAARALIMTRYSEEMRIVPKKISDQVQLDLSQVVKEIPESDPDQI